MKETLPYDVAQAQLNRYVRMMEKRPSRVRDMVLEQVCALPQPFTAEQLIRACAPERISVGTVYNSLNLFLDAHLVHATRRQRGLAATEYEVIAGNESKFIMICGKCGRTVELNDKAISRLIKERKYSNFNLLRFSLYVYGECKLCRSTKAKQILRSRSSIE